MQPTLRNILTGTHMMRDGALARLSNSELAFSPGGSNPALGTLFVQLGETQQGYISALETGIHDWTYRNEDASLQHDVSALQAWFTVLDTRMLALVDGLSEADLQRDIDRGKGIVRSTERQLEIYSEAMLIFLGKLVVYLRAMSKTLPPSIEHYIV